MPRVSIVIPCYNYAKYVGECIKSCAEQSYRDVEVIVVDDASTDRSREVITLWSDHDKRVRRVFCSENGGYSRAKNLGILHASGDLIAHIDADDMLTPNSIEVRVNQFDRDPRVDFVHGYAYRLYGDHGYAWAVQHAKELERRPGHYIHAQGVMLRRSVFQDHGLYYEPLRSKSDKEMWFRLGVHSESPLPRLIEAREIKDIVAFYRKHDLQMHKVRKADKAVNDVIETQFAERIKTLKKEGITRENTRFM